MGKLIHTPDKHENLSKYRRWLETLEAEKGAHLRVFFENRRHGERYKYYFVPLGKAVPLFPGTQNETWVVDVTTPVTVAVLRCTEPDKDNHLYHIDIVLSDNTTGNPAMLTSGRVFTQNVWGKVTEPIVRQLSPRNGKANIVVNVQAEFDPITKMPTNLQITEGDTIYMPIGGIYNKGHDAAEELAKLPDSTSFTSLV